MDLPPQVQAQADGLARYDAEIETARVAAEAEATAAAAPEPATPPAAASTVPPAPPPPPTEDWEQKYRSLQGIFNAQMPVLRAEVASLTANLAAAQQALKAKEVTPASTSETPRPSKVTAADVDAFGADLLDVVKRQAAEIVADAQTAWEAEKTRLTGEITTLRQQVETTAERTVTSDRNKYFGDLAQLVPDYERVNVDPGFIAWLAEAEPLAGVQRQSFLKTAFDGFDARRTADIFSAWKATQAAPAPTLAPPAPPAPAPRTLSVTPGPSRATTPPAPADTAKVWTASEIDVFYREVGRGDFKGREAEQVATVADIDLALAQGRVSP